MLTFQPILPTSGKASAFVDYIAEKKREALPLESYPFTTNSDAVSPFIDAFMDLYRCFSEGPAPLLDDYPYWIVNGGRGIGKTRFCGELASLLFSYPSIRALGLPIVTATCSALVLPPEEAWIDVRPEDAETLETHCLSHLCYQMISNCAAVSDTDLSAFKEKLSDFRTCTRAIRALHKIMAPKWVLLLHIDDFDERPRASTHALRALMKAMASDEQRAENCIIIPVLSGVSAHPLQSLDPGSTIANLRSSALCRQFWVKPLNLEASASFLFNAYFTELIRDISDHNPSLPMNRTIKKEFHHILANRTDVEKHIREIPQFWNLLHLTGGVPSMLLEYAQSMAECILDDIDASLFRGPIALKLKSRISKNFEEPPREILNRAIYESYFSSPIQTDVNEADKAAYDHLERNGMVYRYQKKNSSSEVFSWIPPVLYFIWRPNWFPPALYMMLVDFRFKEIEQCAPFFHRANFLIASSCGKTSVTLSQLYGNGCLASPSTLLDSKIPIPKKLRYAAQRIPKKMENEALSDEDAGEERVHAINIIAHESFGGSVETRSETVDLEELMAKYYFITQSAVLPHYEHWLTPFSGEWYHSLGTTYSRRALGKLTPKRIKTLRLERLTSPSKVFALISPNETSAMSIDQIPEGTILICGPGAVAQFLHGFVASYAIDSNEADSASSPPGKHFQSLPTHWRTLLLDHLAELERNRLFHPKSVVFPHQPL